MPQERPRNLSAEAFGRPFEQVEELERCGAVEYAPKAFVLDDGLRPVSEMPQIGEAHAIDAGRQATFPATPDQPRHVEQIGGVVGHWQEYGSRMGE
jgi:hypothetical protein